MSEHDKNNVIQFPDRPIPHKGKVESSEGVVTQQLETKKLMISGSMASILLALTFFNSSNFSPTNLVQLEDPNQMGRFIASTDVPSRNSTWEHKMAKDLAKKGSRNIASVGRAPSAKETFGFGEKFEGRYAILFDNNKLKSLRLVEGEFGQVEPKYVTDRTEFLMKNKRYIDVEFSKAIQVSNTQNKNELLETYQLVGSNPKTVLAHVKFVLDPHQRILSMKVEQAIK